MRKSTLWIGLLVCLTMGCGGLLFGEEDPAPKVPYLEIGKVKLFRSEKRIEVTGFVAVQRNLIELFACAEGGKAHESVLVLDCRPSNLNLAMKLLGLKDGGQVKVVRKVIVQKDGKEVEEKREVLEENGPNFLGDPRRPEGDRVIVTVRWGKGEKKKEVRAEDMIYERVRKRSMPRAGWIYTGSRFVKNPRTHREEIIADHSKTLMTTWHDPDSLLDNPLPDGGDDEVYFANPDVVPARGTPIVMEIRVPTDKERKEAEAVEAAERKAAADRDRKKEKPKGD
ncbi:MAG: YdjY domain-containing protein [Planctomycetota bacterium]